MKLRMIVLSAAALAAVCGCGKSNEANASAETPAAAETASVSAAASDPSVATAEERAAAIAVLGLEAASGNKVVNDCGEAVTPDIHAVDLGGDVGRALLVVMMGGPNTISCYGMTGMRFFLLRGEGAGWAQIFADFGHFAPMETSHNGVRDFAVGGPGFEFPVYEWSGADFTHGRTIPDTEFPQSVN